MLIYLSNKSGFTLVELLVVIAIIGILANTILTSLNDARQSALIAKTSQEVRTFQNVFAMFFGDTNTIPGRCRIQNNCDALSDPFLNDLGVAGWDGPYIGGGIYDRAHGWGGHIGIENVDYNSDGIIESFLILDDDPPGGIPSNGGQIPNDALLKIDQNVDDGNLSTGRFMSIVPGVSTGVGSAVYLLYP